MASILPGVRDAQIMLNGRWFETWIDGEVADTCRRGRFS
jgi:hypothetical protein